MYTFTRNLFVNMSLSKARSKGKEEEGKVQVTFTRGLVPHAGKFSLPGMVEKQSANTARPPTRFLQNSRFQVNTEYRQPIPNSCTSKRKKKILPLPKNSMDPYLRIAGGKSNKGSLYSKKSVIYITDGWQF